MNKVCKSAIVAFVIFSMIFSFYACSAEEIEAVIESLDDETIDKIEEVVDDVIDSLDDDEESGSSDPGSDVFDEPDSTPINDVHYDSDGNLSQEIFYDYSSGNIVMEANYGTDGSLISVTYYYEDGSVMGSASYENLTAGEAYEVDDDWGSGYQVDYYDSEGNKLRETITITKDTTIYGEEAEYAVVERYYIGEWEIRFTGYDADGNLRYEVYYDLDSIDGLIRTSFYDSDGVMYVADFDYHLMGYLKVTYYDSYGNVIKCAYYDSDEGDFCLELEVSYDTDGSWNVVYYDYEVDEDD